jgi:hypothetical protein
MAEYLVEVWELRAPRGDKVPGKRSDGCEEVLRVVSEQLCVVQRHRVS